MHRLTHSKCRNVIFLYCVLQHHFEEVCLMTVVLLPLLAVCWHLMSTAVTKCNSLSRMDLHRPCMSCPSENGTEVAAQTHCLINFSMRTPGESILALTSCQASGMVAVRMPVLSHWCD